MSKSSDLGKNLRILVQAREVCVFVVGPREQVLLERGEWMTVSGPPALLSNYLIEMQSEFARCSWRFDPAGVILFDVFA